MRLEWTISLFLILTVNQLIASPADTLTTKYDSIRNQKEIDVILSANISQQKNIEETTINILTLASKINYYSASIFTKYRSKKELSINYSYSHYIDSLWIKTNDQLYYSYNWSKKNKGFSRSLIFNFKTQLTNTVIRTRIETRLIGQFGFPSILNLGIGINFQLKEDNYLHISLLNIQETFITSKLNLNRKEFKSLNHDFEFQQQLGVSVVSSLKFKLTKKVIYRNNSKLFIRGLKNNDMNFDIRNQFIVDIYKKVKLCLDNRVFFNPLIQTKIQMSNEILLGIGINRSPNLD